MASIKEEYRKKVLVTELMIRGAVQGKKPEEVNILWSGGKDSTVILHLIKRLYGNVPYRVTFSDCGYEYDEVYAFIKQLTSQWELRLEKIPYGSARAIEQYEKSGGNRRTILTWERSRASREYIQTHGITLTFSGIRWYEHFHNIRHFKRTYAGITLLYPILHWTQDDVWRYIREYNVPYLPLYDRGFTHVTLKPVKTK